MRGLVFLAAMGMTAGCGDDGSSDAGGSGSGSGGETQTASSTGASTSPSTTASSDGGTGSAADCGPLGHTLSMVVDGVDLPVPEYTLGQETPIATSTSVGGSYHEEVEGFDIGLENQAMISFGNLALGANDAAEVVGLQYREFPAANEPRAADLIISGPITGTVTVVALPAETGDPICGTFELTASGTKTVELSGHFHHTLNDEPEPGPGG